MSQSEALIEEDSQAPEVAEQDTQYLNMSDEEFQNLSYPVEDSAPDQPPEQQAPEEDEAEPEEAAPEPAEQAAQEAPEDEQTPAEQAAAVDFEAAYNKLVAPFKANGKDMQIDNVEDAIKLMQLGANYNKKMAAMKPGLKALKMLENNGLLDESKLNYLIDLSRKDPGAIAKLIKDSNVELMDIDLNKSEDYKPSSNNVGDIELELDSVLEEIKDSPTYNRTLDVVSTKWDSTSRKTVANQPQLLKVINDHLSSGVYELINTAVEREKMLGNLSGMTDIEAYRTIGDSIEAKGGFDHLFSTKQSPAPVSARPLSAVAKTANPAVLNDKRRAAANPKAEASTPNPNTGQFNPLAMSDEDFEKQLAGKFL